jgi:hypothetical protein
MNSQRAWTAALSVQHYSILCWLGEQSLHWCLSRPANSDIYMQPYTTTYSNESGANNAALHANIPSPVVLRSSKSQDLANARFESQLGHWLSCLRVFWLFSVIMKKIPHNFSYSNQCGPVLSALCPGCFHHLSMPLLSIPLASGTLPWTIQCSLHTALHDTGIAKMNQKGHGGMTLMSGTFKIWSSTHSPETFNPRMLRIIDVLHTFHMGHPNRKCPENRGLMACSRLTVASSIGTVLISLIFLQNCEMLTII